MIRQFTKFSEKITRWAGAIAYVCLNTQIYVRVIKKDNSNNYEKMKERYREKERDRDRERERQRKKGLYL